MSENDDNLLQDSVEYKRWKAGINTEDVTHFCPRGCKEPLEYFEGIHCCNECDGVKVSVEKLAEGTEGMLEKINGSEFEVKDIISGLIRKSKEKKLTCPFCNKKMNEIELKYDPNHVDNFQPITGGAMDIVVRGPDHPIFLLFGVILLSVEAVNLTGHLAKKTVSAVKTKAIKTVTIDGCAKCESMWFDGEKYGSSMGSYGQELAIFERFWSSLISKNQSHFSNIKANESKEEKWERYLKRYPNQQQNEHNKKEINITYSKEKNKYQCTDCNFESSSKNFVKRHIEGIHGVQ
tara:strand:+ start:42 stop:917 length:876 start_codon:yes stop_codon:yes gene_type:complete